MKLLNECPICGGSLYMDSLYQYSIIHKIGARGNLLKKKTKMDNGSMDAHMIYCENWDFKTDYDLEVVEPTNMQIQVYSQYGTCHSIEILDDSEMIKIVSEYVKKKKGKLEKMLEELL